MTSVTSPSEFLDIEPLLLERLGCMTARMYVLSPCNSIWAVPSHGKIVLQIKGSPRAVPPSFHALLALQHFFLKLFSIHAHSYIDKTVETLSGVFVVHGGDLSCFSFYVTCVGNSSTTVEIFASIPRKRIF